MTGSIPHTRAVLVRATVWDKLLLDARILDTNDIYKRHKSPPLVTAGSWGSPQSFSAVAWIVSKLISALECREERFP